MGDELDCERAVDQVSVCRRTKGLGLLSELGAGFQNLVGAAASLAPAVGHIGFLNVSHWSRSTLCLSPSFSSQYLSSIIRQPSFFITIPVEWIMLRGIELTP